MKRLLCTVCGDSQDVADDADANYIAALSESHEERCQGSPYKNGHPVYQAWSDYEAPDPLIDFEFKHPMGESPKPVQKL